jgi:hypothetical protein
MPSHRIDGDCSGRAFAAGATEDPAVRFKKLLLFHLFPRTKLVAGVLSKISDVRQWLMKQMRQVGCSGLGSTGLTCMV